MDYFNFSQSTAPETQDFTLDIEIHSCNEHNMNTFVHPNGILIFDSSY